MITNKKAQDWRTPQPLFWRLHAEYRFTRDMAASIANHLLPDYWTRAHNAFRQDWSDDRGFWNCPFANVAEWLEYAIWMRDNRDAFSVGLVLGSIETAWFHDLAVNTEKHLFRRRVAYTPPPNVKASQPSFPSILLIQQPGFKRVGNGMNFHRVRDGVSGDYIDDGNNSLSDALFETKQLPSFVDGGIPQWSAQEAERQKKIAERLDYCYNCKTNTKWVFVPDNYGGAHECANCGASDIPF